MPKGTNQKFKLYRLAQIMLEQTDDEHYITMPEIKEELARYDITADRKSIYYTVDAIHNAISENRKICFQYFQWNVKKWSCGGTAHGTTSVRGGCPGTMRITIWWDSTQTPGKSGITGWTRCSISG